MTLINDTAVTTLGRKIRTARVVADMKQQELAAVVGVSRSAVSLWENGETEPSATKLIAIAQATKQPLGWFAEGLDLGVVRPKGLEPLTFWFRDTLEDWSNESHQIDVEYQLLCAVEAVAL